MHGITNIKRYTDAKPFARRGSRRDDFEISHVLCNAIIQSRSNLWQLNYSISRHGKNVAWLDGAVK